MMPDIKVMLVFAQVDHAQAALDKPHIHQAYQGFRFEAGSVGAPEPGPGICPVGAANRGE